MEKIDTRARRFLHKALSYATVPGGRIYQHFGSKNNGFTGSDITGIVFIVGAPRTGTTLFYQVLTNMLNVGYLSNLSNLFYHSLMTGMVFHDRLFGARPHNSFISDNGRTRRWIDVNESGKFWYQWYPKDTPCLDDEVLAGTDFSEMVSTIRRIQARLGKPLVFKNQTNSQRVSSLARLFPDSFFIHVTRDPLATAKSIIRQRKRMLGSPEKWYSIKPENYEQIKNFDYVEQVVRQIYGVDQMIKRDFAQLDADRCMTVKYEDLGQKWPVIVDAVQDRLTRFCPVEKRSGAQAPEIKIKHISPGQVDDPEIRTIKEKIEQVYG
ncbi:MAG: sulfotransferase family protein [Desulfosalsimonas sp.]